MSLLNRHSRLLFRTIKYNNRSTFTRTMATATSGTTAQKTEWLVIIPDLPGKLERRLAVRDKHIHSLKEGFQSGFWKMGGAYLEDVPKEGETLKALGSAVIASAETREEVIQKLKEDIYAENKVWDFEKVLIYPFKCAFRSAI